MKTLRKSDTCLNCQTPLKPEDNYCPNCGQENNHRIVPVSHLLFETVESFVHIDSKLWNTLKATFTRPGKITVEYLEGKRASYVPPVKFYVFVSFVFFLLVGMQSDDTIDGAYKSNKASLSISETESLSISELLGTKTTYGNSDKSKISQIELTFADSSTFASIISYYHNAPDKTLDSLLLQEEIDTTAENREALRLSLQKITTTTKQIDSLFNKQGNTEFGNLKFANKAEYEKFKQELPFLSNNQLDSIIKSKGEEPGWFKRQLIRKMSRFNANDPEFIKQLVHAILKSISITMFVMMPLTAILLLFIFYRKKYYYEHLIFSIHTHTVFFILFSFILIIQLFVSKSFGAGCWSWAFLLCFVYLVLSLKKVYKQSWGRTIGKLILMSIPYFVVSLTLVIFAILYGFLA